MSDHAPFPARQAALQAKHPNPHRFEAACEYLNLETQWAAALEASDKPGAIRHLAEAERHQATIGSFATGSGEGLASMACLHDLMLRRAALEEQCADDPLPAAQKRKHLQNALTVLQEIDRSPNKPTGGRLAQAMRRVAARLAQS